MDVQDRSRDERVSAPVTPSVRDEDITAHGWYRIGLTYGRFIHRARWIVIAVWVLAVVASLPFDAKIGSVLTGGGYSLKGSESIRAGDIIQQTLHEPPSTVLVVFHSSATPVSDSAYQTQVAAFVARAQNFPHVAQVQLAGISADQLTTYYAVGFDTNEDATQHQMAAFEQIVPHGAGAGPATAYVTGSPAVYNTFTNITQQDTKSAELAALPIALVVLLFVFGAFLAALLPLALALFAVPTALAIIYFIALHTTTSVFVENIASIIGLGISIDYSLFMTRRFRDELGQGRATRDAVGWTVATAGEAILFSGLTVMIGFCGLLLIGVPFMTSFGIGGAVVVACSVLAALTLLPALMGVLGHRINALRMPFVGRMMAPRAQEGAGRQSFWAWWARVVTTHPIVIALAVSIVLVVMALPIFSINIGTPTSSALPAGTEARVGLDLITANFRAASDNPVYIVAQTPDGSSMLTAENVSRVDALTTWLAQQPHVTGVSGITRPPQSPSSAAPAPTEAQLEQLYGSGAYQQQPGLAQLVARTTNGGTTLITVATDAPVDSANGKALIDNLRHHYASAAQGLTVLVGGTQALSLDFNRYLYGNFPKAIAFVLVTTFFLLLLLFRSVVIPLKAIVMNVLSVCASYGVLIFIFQWGHFSNLLGFTADGYLDSTIPILLFCILFGLSMDYEVFLLSRIREEWLRTGKNRYAVETGLEKTGGVITNAALLFVIVTGAFTFTRVTSTKEIGLGMTVAVLVDATIIRSLLVPATM
ncbi:MAG TPA: MMPL family transporter, partial [Ktedonobacterales bacterium]